MLIIPNTDASSYTTKAGTLGDLGSGTFSQGPIENVGATRSDFYEIQPGTGDATFVGYFDLFSNGAMSFTAAPEPGSWVLLAAGGLGLFAWNQRRRSASRS